MEASIRLSPHPTSARAAREFVAEVLEGWGLLAQVEPAVLLTSELVTNAIIHARSQIALTIRMNGENLRVMVLDESSEQPRRRHRDDLGSGRGLGLVDALAVSWGVTPSGQGKAVWFELT
jgi:anti-sigma regulatory factor (Ser/Thr protein kinase)